MNVQGFKNRIKELRGNETLDKFGERIGFSKGTLASWEKGTMPGIDAFGKLAEKLPNVNPLWLLYGSGEKYIVKDTPSPKGFKTVPLIENVSCGTSFESQIDPDSVMPIYDTTHKNKSIIAVRAKGNSMEPYIRENDIVLCYKVDRGDKIRNNAAYVIDYMNVSPGNKEGVCKIVHEFNNYLFLVSINTYKHDPIILPKDQVRGLYKVYKVIRDVS